MKTKSEIINPTCNILTVKDQRGAIWTYKLNNSYKELNHLFFKPLAVRGFHKHDFFDEIFMVTEGNGVLQYKDSETGEIGIIQLSVGTCVLNPKGVAHVVYASNEMRAIALLTEYWDDCNPPITRVEI